MPEYATRSFLNSWTNSIAPTERTIIVEKAENRSPATSTFLSHSTKDSEQLPAVVKLLSNHGAAVYIDKKDENLPPFTSRDTAKILRSRINVCKKFVLFATINSKDSKWMPWELGLADGYKTTANVAILPTVETIYETAWTEREYLGVYDRIVWGKLKGFEKELWMVWDQEKNEGTELSRWLKQ